jgi:hypothetical protein
MYIHVLYSVALRDRGQRGNEKALRGQVATIPSALNTKPSHDWAVYLLIDKIFYNNDIIY